MGRDYRGTMKQGEGDDKYVHYLDHDDGFTSVYVSKLIKLHTLNMCSLLYLIFLNIEMACLEESA